MCERHDFCCRWSALNGIPDSLPSRLLEVNLTEDFPQVRLVKGQDLARGSRYTTLSYCWGGIPAHHVAATQHS